ncbi:hypothetical protein N7456_004477 [Penicillium angulare]|uniref:Enoyl reductase (ER) domain-containing protein n=1 Tax=Penicillium angulare TaxID=116970 RepID=A0A9W9FWM3_9EURO|nr:hypothetical protein N7456_004477 [Penicillium angulare]
MSFVPTHHQAALISEKGSQFAITERETPKPGPGELLVKVKAAAVNPVDYYQREMGIFIEKYPAIVGSDIAGVVAETGPEMRPDAPKKGDRVIAFASAWLNAGKPDYGAFQEYVLVSQDIISFLPESFSFVEGSVFPMAAWVSWNAWLWAGIPRGYQADSSEGVLIWGAGSSMGALAVQEAKLMGFGAVYATASEKNHEYIRGLGATRVFDYKDEGVLESIVSAAREDGVKVKIGFHATGEQQVAVNVMGALKSGEGVSKMGIAPVLDPELKVPDGVETAFLLPPDDEEARRERTRWIFGDWLQTKLADGEVVASPHIKLVEGGLESTNKALDEWKAGVSCTKIVFEV